jgi:PhoH-like ATPase
MRKKEKIFVLDTSVLLHDFDAIVNFKEHYVAIPITVLEELDKFKIGNDTKNFSAREVIRFIDKLSGSGSLQEWITLGKTLGKFKVVMDDTNNTADVIDRNQLVGQIYLQPTRTVEYILLDFNILPTGATFGS